MSRFIFFTKTQWDEPPRIRHQLARLLADAGHEILFFQKPELRWWKRTSRRSAHAGSRIFLHRHRELIHHKLRLTRLLHHSNALVVKRSVALATRHVPIGAEDTIVNFNYEYWFLRDLFPHNRLITVINDDFVSRALFGYARPVHWAIQRTCRSSSRVLAVSLPLCEQLQAYCKPELFLPWADRPYRPPADHGRRNTLLFWGYINGRVDFSAMREYARRLMSDSPDVRILFVGPIDTKSRSDVRCLGANRNVEFLSPMQLDDLPLDRVLAGLMPYRRDLLSIDAATLPNKALQLLARGIPLLISGMPNFLDAPFVFRMEPEQPAENVNTIAQMFTQIQPAIEQFVSANSAQIRLAQFLGEST